MGEPVSGPPITVRATNGGTVELREFVEALVDHALALHSAKLDALERVSNERDIRYNSQGIAADKAITAALAAAEKAVTTALVSAEKLTAQASTASEKAIDKAEKAQAAYNERSNEFRDALDDQAKLQMSRAEALASLARLEQRMDEQKTDISDTRSSIAALAAAMRAERTKEIDTKIDAIIPRLTIVEAFMIRTSGQAQGISNLWIVVLGAAALLGTVLGGVAALNSLGGT